MGDISEVTPGPEMLTPIPDKFKKFSIYEKSFSTASEKLYLRNILL